MKLYQINEADLAELESTLPRLADRLMPTMTNADRAAIRRVQRVLVDVRWGYGPPTDVETISPDLPPS